MDILFYLFYLFKENRSVVTIVTYLHKQNNPSSAILAQALLDYSDASELMNDLSSKEKPFKTFM